MLAIDQNLSNFSDIAVLTAAVIYTVALFMSMVYYVRIQAVIDARRVQVKQKELVGAGAPIETRSEYEEPVDSEAVAKQERFVERLGGMLQSLIWLGIAIHVAGCVLRGLATGRFPFGNLYEYALMITAGAMLIAAIFIQRKEHRTLWPWLLVPILALVFYAYTVLYAESAPVVPALQSYWLPVHVTTVALGGSIGIFSGIASVLHLLRESQPKGREHGFLGKLAKPLPSAKKLDQLAYRTAVITLPTLGLGIVLGAIWAESAWGRFWGWDPKETVSFATWILYAAYLHARATPSWRKAAPWINVIALATMVFNLFFINMVVSGLHSYAGLN